MSPRYNDGQIAVIQHFRNGACRPAGSGGVFFSSPLQFSGISAELWPTLAAHRQGRPLTHVLIELAAGHELSYHLTERHCSIHMLCAGYTKVNPTGIESIHHLRPRRRPPLRHPL